MSASATATALRADSRLSVAPAPGISIDGRPAQVLDVQLAPGYVGTCDTTPSVLLFDEPGSFVVLEGEQRWRLILLDVDDVPLVVVIWPEEESVDAFVARAMAVIEGITFQP